MTVNRRSWLNCRPLWFRAPRLFRIALIVTSLVLGPFQRRWCFDPRKIRALLLVRDIHSPLPSFVNSLLSQGISSDNIILVDSGSTDHDCLNTLASLERRGCRLIRLPLLDQSYGPYACWLSTALRSEISSWKYPYLVSDTDLNFPNNIPADWLYKLFEVLNINGGIAKSSLPLQVADITVDNYAEIQIHEKKLASNIFYSFFSMFFLRSGPGSVICPTDTTISLYRPSRIFSTLSIRLPLSYSVRHLPWYVDFIESSEYKYYQSRKISLFGEWS